MQNTSHYSQTLNVRVPRHGRAYCRVPLVCVGLDRPLVQARPRSLRHRVALGQLVRVGVCVA